jgi:ABC-type nitrate/sulfonate/bicarbonate transport system substrate-binding protein
MQAAVRSALVLGPLLLVPTASASAQAQALTKVGVVLNFAADGGAAGFYHALERGYFRELGLDVRLEPSKGSADAITRTASQASDIGSGSAISPRWSNSPRAAPRFRQRRYSSCTIARHRR